MQTLAHSSSSVKSPFLFSQFNPKSYPLFPAAKGDRHPQLFSFASHLRYYGAEEADILRQTTEANHHYNVPRKETTEIIRIAQYVSSHYLPGHRSTEIIDFDVANRALGWLADRCFTPFFAGKRGCTDFSVLYVILSAARKARKIDVNLSCRDAALEAGITPCTASRSLRRLCRAGYLTRVGNRKMDQAQTYSLGAVLCLHPTALSWRELSSAMFRISRAAAKLQLIYGDIWQNTNSTRNALSEANDRVLNTKRLAAQRVLKRKGLDSLGKAEDDAWRFKMWQRIQHERKLFADFVWQVRREKSRSRGKEGKLVLKMAA